MSYQAEANRKHYQKYKSRRTAENRAYKHKVKMWLKEYRAFHPCMVCGEKDECCLDFHHRNPEEKEIEVTTAIQQGWSVQRLMTEIIKCDILCANCHRKHHRDTRIKSFGL